MRFFKVIAVGLSVWIVSIFGSGQLYAQIASSAQKVHPSVELAKNVIPAGDSVDVAILLNIKEGWHVNAHEPTLDYLIGTNLVLNLQDGFSQTKLQYPKSRKFKFTFANKPLDVYQGRAPIFVTLKTSSGLSPGSYKLQAKLRVQACNDNSCLAPSTIEIPIPVQIVSATSAYKSQNEDLFADYQSGEKNRDESKFTALSNNSVSVLFNERDIIWAFLSVFLIGLALNLTPCVYPMLSVTISLFGGQLEQKEPATQRLKMASVYVLGIVSMYSVLGVLAAYTGQLFGGWLQSSVLLAVVGFVLLAMAFSMFGLYELQPPQWVLQKLGKSNNKLGTGGHFLSGVMVGIFAAPCIGPPVIALLAFVGAQGDPFFGFSVFATMALGLGLPYLLLGSFSGLLTKLPKSGEWMIWVKRLFGTVLIGTALFFLALAFYPKFVLYTLPPSLILGGIYLGFLDRSGSDGKYFRRFKWLVGLAGIAGGVLIIFNLAKPTIEWTPYRKEALSQAIAGKTPVVLDFYADWCVPCLELDRITFTDPDVIEALGHYRTIKVDLTNYSSPQAESIRKQYDVAGVPTIIFLNREGKEIKKARIVGFVNPKEFLKRMPDEKAMQLSED